MRLIQWIAGVSLFSLWSLNTALAAENAVQFLEKRVKNDPDDFLAWNQLGSRHLDLLRKTGDDEHLRRAADAATQSLKAIPAAQNTGGLALRARVELASHRFAAGRDSARELAKLVPAKTYPRLIEGDALLELGDYETAEREYNEVLRLDGSTVDIEARLARLDMVYGRMDSARDHLQSALELAKDLGIPSESTVAWCYVQLGELAFKRGDWPEAEKQYEGALAALPEYVAALDHQAELLGAEGKTEGAIAAYQSLVQRAPRPPILQALGDLYAFNNRPAEAQPWHERALAAYLDSVNRGEVHYFHHLAGFYADSVKEPALAVEYARKDMALRGSIQAWDSLAWALYKDGQMKEALEAITKATGTGSNDPHILYHAGLIRMSAGNLADGRADIQKAAAANPRYNTFHVHR